MTSQRDVPTRKLVERPPTVTIEALITDGSDHEFRELVALLFAVSGRLQSMRRELARVLHLSIAEFSVLTALMYLEQKGNVRVRTIADHLYIAAAQVTAIVKRLESAGWVEKRSDPSDRRAVSLRLSDMALDRLAEFAPLLCTVNDRWFAGMSRSELLIVSDFLRRLVLQYDGATIKVGDMRNGFV